MKLLCIFLFQIIKNFFKPMSDKPFRISGTGCSLVDYLYKPVDFSGKIFKEYLSAKPGDGGLSPGRLVFTGELEKFAGKTYPEIRHALTVGMDPVAVNIGGPSIVSLIHAAQLCGQTAGVYFYGCSGNDDAGAFIRQKLSTTPLNTGFYKTTDSHTPFTDVLSDPNYDSGHGERVFINNIGAAWDFFSEDLDEDFYNSQITVFGGTALVPNIHADLRNLLMKARDCGSLTIVNTVFDFISEKRNPAEPWPLGDSNDTYRHIDLLIADREEALRHSGGGTPEEALEFFRQNGVGAVIITQGPNPVNYYADNKYFGNLEPESLPASHKVIDELAKNPALAGDTTGCGDNFTGGVIASIAGQMIDAPERRVDLKAAIALGVSSGGFACFFHGGTFYEKFPGEKLQLVNKYYDAYLIQNDIHVR
jgi:sugar/nucleoside kinase (ribokinase family)